MPKYVLPEGSKRRHNRRFSQFTPGWKMKCFLWFLQFIPSVSYIGHTLTFYLPIFTVFSSMWFQLEFPISSLSLLKIAFFHQLLWHSKPDLNHSLLELTSFWGWLFMRQESWFFDRVSHNASLKWLSGLLKCFWFLSTVASSQSTDNLGSVSAKEDGENLSEEEGHLAKRLFRRSFRGSVGSAPGTKPVLGGLRVNFESNLKCIPSIVFCWDSCILFSPTTKNDFKN